MMNNRNYFYIFCEFNEITNNLDFEKSSRYVFHYKYYNKSFLLEKNIKRKLHKKIWKYIFNRYIPYCCLYCYSNLIYYINKLSNKKYATIFLYQV